MNEPGCRVYIGVSVFPLNIYTNSEKKPRSVASFPFIIVMPRLSRIGLSPSERAPGVTRELRHNPVPWLIWWLTTVNGRRGVEHLMPTYYKYSFRLLLTEHPAITTITSNPKYDTMAKNKQVKDGIKSEQDNVKPPQAHIHHEDPEVNIMLPINRPERDDDHPLAWDRCAICRSRGNYRHMFHCDGCEEAFHPGCLARRSPRNHGDPRFISFTCRRCRDQERRTKRSRHE